MSFPLVQLGGQAFNHHRSDEAEAEYDRLRSLARQEQAQCSRYFDQAHQAFQSGDGAAAHQLSEEGRRHLRQKDQYNRLASEYIFRENNAEGRVASDTIDLHGQFVEEAEDILERRIRAAQAQGQDHLHVIVGKGNHSVNHVQRLKPRVEQLCRELGLEYTIEDNAGRIYVNLRGGPAHLPHEGHHHGQPSQPHQGGTHHAPPHHQEDAIVKKVVRKLLPKVVKQLHCCVVM
ncbi:MAG: geranylgeranyl pyrophosphate synthetase [Watsoniomyces obsoletus]|nr:MAG: geranylgeranyl pyrophosphate synthetase [Watsoniomyces obsoletus]